MPDPILLAGLFFAAAALYSTVGHAGASGYLAVMALTGMPGLLMKPVALVLNVLVASIASVRFFQAGCFSWRTFWPFVVGSVPMAFIGGAWQLPNPLYKKLVGVILLVAAVQLMWSTIKKRAAETQPEKPPAIPLAIACGAGIGLLAGLTGTGGGIFLTPLLLFCGWAEAKKSAGISAAFILVNSLSGLAGQAPNIGQLPEALPLWGLAVVAGGFVGSELGSRRLGYVGFRRALSAVLVVAAVKLMLT